jgi:hypothetical protein
MRMVTATGPRLDLESDYTSQTPHVLLLALILCLTMLLYWPALQFPYLYDDTRDLPMFLKWDGWRSLFAVPWLHPARYLTWVSFQLTHHLSTHPIVADHAVSLAIHGVNVTLVAVVLWPFERAAAIGAAGLFALHPLQTEAVAYVGGRPDLLMATGLLIALVGVSWSLASCVMIGIIVAALSKETGIMALPVVWLWSRAIDCRVRLLGAALGCAGLFTMLHIYDFYGSGYWASPVEVFRHAAMLWRLSALVIWPFGFTIDHAWTWITRTASMIAMLAWICMAIGGLYDRRAWALLAVPLLLLPRLLLNDSEPLHEHHLYAPMVCLSIMIGAWYFQGEPVNGRRSIRQYT